jgi:hypothetical protein
MLFGVPTDRSRNLAGKDKSPGPEPAPDQKPKGKRKDHGRRGAAEYPGAKTVVISPETLKAGAPCPDGCGGKIYDTHRPATSIRFVAQPLIDATRYEQQHLRCSKCGRTHTAELPKEARQKYDDNVGPALGVARYGFGLPMNRMVDLQQMFGIPMPLGTQYDQIEACYKDLGELVMRELIRQAAQGKVVYNDDTPGRVLDLEQTIKERRAVATDDEKIRTGIFTTGVVSTGESHSIVVYATGNKHAGENLHDILIHRSPDLEAPIQMCDGLSRNNPDKTEKGAKVGDFFMSVIHTCRLCNVNPIHYLTTLRRKITELTANPDQWMPWNYQLNDTAPA